MYSAVSRISGTADTSQILTNSADPSPNKYLNPHVPKLQLAVPLKPRISANKELTCLRCKDFIKTDTQIYYNPNYLPSRNDSMIKTSENVCNKIFLLSRMYYMLYCYSRLILCKY